MAKGDLRWASEEILQCREHSPGKEREDAGIGSGRMMSGKSVAGDRHYCSRNSMGLELCKCQQGPLTRMLDAGR